MAFVYLDKLEESLSHRNVIVERLVKTPSARDSAEGVVMCYAEKSVHRYVTWRFRVSKKEGFRTAEFFSGHYFFAYQREDAEKDFAKRAA